MPPSVPEDITDLIRKIQAEVRDLQGRVNIRPAMNAVLGGDVTIGDGGRLIVKTPGGNDVLYIGRVDPDHPDGTDQQGFIVRREDGSVALSVWTAAGSGVQPLQMYDKAGQIILADDLNGGGLARPYLEGGSWFGAVEQPTFVTTSPTFVTVTMSPWYKQHPKVTAFYLVRCSDGTTAGEIQLTDNEGTAISPVIPISAGSFFYGSITGPIAGTHESQTYLRWTARVTAGAGNIGVKGLAVYGVQS